MARKDSLMDRYDSVVADKLGGAKEVGDGRFGRVTLRSTKRRVRGDDVEQFAMQSIGIDQVNVEKLHVDHGASCPG